ncbi:MAG: hypothetical protein V3W41_22275 [Planctomycetota bacterium]
MSSRVTFDHWGVHGPIEIPAYAMARPFESRLSAVTRAIGAKSRLTVCTCSPQGSDGARCHYQLTLGRPVGDGYSVEVSVWIALVKPGEECGP